MFKFADLDKRICLTCQYFTGRRNVEVIGSKMFIEYETDKGTCRIFNNFPVIINEPAGRVHWCKYKRWTQLPDVSKSPPKPSSSRKTAKQSDAPHPLPKTKSRKTATSMADSSSESCDESVYETPKRQSGCLGRLIKSLLLLGILYWVVQKYQLMPHIKTFLGGIYAFIVSVLNMSMRK